MVARDDYRQERDEALAERDALREELAGWRTEANRYAERYDTERAEVQRLRGALERLANWRCTHAVDPIHELAMQNVARTALEPLPERNE